MSGTLKISELVFRANPTGTGQLRIRPNNVVILVGPNNSGKSLALREVETVCKGGEGQLSEVISEIKFDFPVTRDAILGKLTPFLVPNPNPSSPRSSNILFVTSHHGPGGGAAEIDLDQLVNQIRSDPNGPYVRNILLGTMTIRLDGKTRFSLSEPQEAGDLQTAPRNHLWRLFVDDIARERVSSLSAEAFGLYFVIDPTSMGRYRIRLSTRPPVNVNEERGLDSTAIRFHSQAKEISGFSDGVQAFVGLISALESLPHKVILIDEPEAFLHPPLARRLGGSITNIASRRNASVITATHSADFLMGCVEMSPNVLIVRLTYENNVATAKALLETDIQLMVKDPLLRSTGVLRGLFHRAVIVTESDADRAFYDEINIRLLQNGRGIKDSLFLNAQNKQTIRKLVGPLRKIGVPAVAVVDLDLSKDAGDLDRLMIDCNIPSGQRGIFETERLWFATLMNSIVRTDGEDPFKFGGLYNITVPADRNRGEAFLNNLSEYGVFLLPVGEVERWLSSLGVGGLHGPKWLIQLFLLIGQSPSDAAYLHPANNDVWTFIDQINTWVSNPSRLGMA